MKRFCFLLVFQIILMVGTGLIHSASAGNALLVDRQTDTYNLAPHLSYIEDAKGTLTIDQVRQPDSPEFIY